MKNLLEKDVEFSQTEISNAVVLFFVESFLEDETTF